jgi:tRNA A37 threonylcarbamoyladenosine dehydratase
LKSLKEFGLVEKEVLEIMKKVAEKFEMWKKKAAANKPKPKPIKIDDFDEDLDGKLSKISKNTLKKECFFF